MDFTVAEILFSKEEQLGQATVAKGRRCTHVCDRKAEEEHI